MIVIEDGICAVMVPSNTHGHSYCPYRNRVSAHETNEPFDDVDWFSEKLPDGNYEKIGLFSVEKPLSEEECARLPLKRSNHDQV